MTIGKLASIKLGNILTVHRDVVCEPKWSTCDRSSVLEPFVDFEVRLEVDKSLRHTILFFVVILPNLNKNRSLNFSKFRFNHKIILNIFIITPCKFNVGILYNIITKQ